jgi:hypothetical protein
MAQKINKTFERIINIFMHVCILLLLLTLLFYNYIETVESNNLNNEIKQSTEKLFSLLLKNTVNIVDKYIIDDNAKIILWDSLYKFGDLEKKKANESIQFINDNNKHIFKNIITLNIIIIMLLIIIIIIAKYIWGINFKIYYITIENIIIFIFAGFLEFIFFYKIIQHYIPATSTNVLNAVISNLKSFIKTI